MAGIIDFLHTTAAYKQAVVQLMIGEANFAATNLGYPPIRGTNEMVSYEVMPPPAGFAGGIVTTNLVIHFERGRIRYFGKPRPDIGRAEAGTNYFRDALAAPARSFEELHSAATNLLSALGVDLVQLETACRFYASTNGIPLRRFRSDLALGDPESDKLLNPPFVQTAWSTNKPKLFFGYGAPASVTINTVDLSIKDAWIHANTSRSRPKLRVTNTIELLSPVPTPEQWTTQFLGGAEAARIVKEPDKVSVVLLDSSKIEGGEVGPERSQTITLSRHMALRASATIGSFDSYAWGSQKLCGEPAYGAKLVFEKDRKTLEVALCFGCADLRVQFGQHVSKDAFDFSHNELLEIVRSAFPGDAELKEIEKKEPEAARRSYLDALNSMRQAP
jgi:hypothetical protein